MLIENTLQGVRDKVQIVIDRMKNFEPTDGYYLAFSGGKDSITLYRLAELAGVKFNAHYNITTVDPPELVQFIKHKYPEVERHHPERSMWDLIEYHQFPPLRHMRYCCQELKETGGRGRVILTGIRWAESTRRKRRQMVESCYRDSVTSYVHPIIDWNTKEIWEFIHKNKLAYCSLYDEGFRRLGCVLCPMHNPKNAKRDIDRWPRIAAQYLRTFEKVRQLRVNSGKEMSFKTAQEFFDWWIRRKSNPKRGKTQPVLFE